MKGYDPELERRLAELRGAAEPALADKRRVLASVRAVIELKSTPPPPANPSGSPVGEPAPPANREHGGAARSADGHRLWPWLGGALIGAALGLGLSFGWRHAESAPAQLAARNPDPASAEPAALASSPRQLSSTPSDTIAVSPLETPAAPPGVSAAVVFERMQRRDPASRDATARREATSNVAARAPQRGAHPPERTLDLESALELLHRAEQALHAAEPQLALGLLGDLDRRAARALLRQERLTTLALALCQLERQEEARAASRELQHEFAGSIYAARLERSCAASPSGDSSR